MDSALLLTAGGILGIGMYHFLSRIPVTCMTKVPMRTVDGLREAHCGCDADYQHQVFRCPEGHETKR